LNRIKKHNLHHTLKNNLRNLLTLKFIASGTHEKRINGLHLHYSDISSIRVNIGGMQQQFQIKFDYYEGNKIYFYMKNLISTQMRGHVGLVFSSYNRQFTLSMYGEMFATSSWRFSIPILINLAPSFSFWSFLPEDREEDKLHSTAKTVDNLCEFTSAIQFWCRFCVHPLPLFLRGLVFSTGPQSWRKQSILQVVLWGHIFFYCSLYIWYWKLISDSEGWEGSLDLIELWLTKHKN
jgi:hypothetical protein